MLFLGRKGEGVDKTKGSWGVSSILFAAIIKRTRLKTAPQDGEGGRGPYQSKAK